MPFRLVPVASLRRRRKVTLVTTEAAPRNSLITASARLAQTQRVPAPQTTLAGKRVAPLGDVTVHGSILRLRHRNRVTFQSACGLSAPRRRRWRPFGAMFARTAILLFAATPTPRHYPDAGDQGANYELIDLRGRRLAQDRGWLCAYQPLCNSRPLPHRRRVLAFRRPSTVPTAERPAVQRSAT